MRKNYHQLYVPHELWQEVMWAAEDQTAKKPTDLALDYIRCGLTTGNEAVSVHKRPSVEKKEKNNKKKKEIVKELLLLCMYTGDLDDMFRWEDNPAEVDKWRLFCTKMDKLEEFQKCFVTESGLAEIQADEDAPCKHIAEFLYHEWNTYNDNMDAERDAFKPIRRQG